MAAKNDLLGLPKLNTIRCGKENYRRTRALDLQLFPSITELIVDDHSFNKTELFPIFNLSQLENVQFGENAFCMTSSVYMFDLPLLKRIVFGKRSFLKATTIHLASRKQFYDRFPCIHTELPFSWHGDGK